MKSKSASLIYRAVDRKLPILKLRWCVFGAIQMIVVLSFVYVGTSAGSYLKALQLDEIDNIADSRIIICKNYMSKIIILCICYTKS